MPLSNAIPAIDNRTYEQLRQEVLTRIPRYTPEWTDFNDNDFGIALTQLFAWMTEMLIFRMQQVPELNYIMFLQLLGIELEPAQPATTQITFPLKDTFTGQWLTVPAGTQVSASVTGADESVVFETDRALTAIVASLAAVQVFDGYSYITATDANTGATDGFQPFGALANPGSALLLGFSAALPAIELDLAFFVPNNPAAPRPVDCNAFVATAVAPSKITWDYWDGAAFSTLAVRADQTGAFTVSGHIRMQMPAAGKMQPSVINGSPSLYWIRAYLQSTQYAAPPMLLAIRTNTVPATQAQTIQNEILGGSNGQRNQTFQLGNTPVLDGTLQLQIDQGEGFVTWNQVEDFFSSGPNDLVYVLDATSGQIRTGDGVNGAIPVANFLNPDANVQALSYKTGGGAVGNVPANSLTTLTTSIDGVDDQSVTNMFAAMGGQDEETIDHAKARAPQTIKSRDRAVTAGDFEYLATCVGQVARAKALPLFDPNFPDIDVPGVVTVIVIPAAPASNPNPIPSDALLRAVCAYLNDRRLLTCELYVIAPTYQRVQVQGTVIAADGTDTGEINSEIEQNLLDYFHPLIGGDDGQGWPIGGPIRYSRVYQRIMSVPGVQSISSLTIVVDEGTGTTCTDVAIKPYALLYSTSHSVFANYA